MGHQQDRAVLLAGELLHQGHDLAARAAVKGGCRFVGQHQRWAVHQGPRHGDPLFLTARQLIGVAVELGCQTHLLQHRGGAVVHGRAIAFAPHLQGHAHVLQCGQAAVQVVGLKDVAMIAAGLTELPVAAPDQLTPQHLQAAALAMAQGADQGQQGGLARSRRAGQQHDLTGCHRQGDVVQHRAAQAAAAEVVPEPRNVDRRFPGHGVLRTARPGRPPGADGWRSHLRHRTSARSAETP